MFVYFNFRMSYQDETSINTISYHLLQGIPIIPFLFSSIQRNNVFTKAVTSNHFL